MARKVFISFLGTNNYLQCHYTINGKISVLTRFIQEALINHYCMEWTESDEIIIFGTDGEMGSIQKNWHDGGHKKESENKEIENKGLFGILKSKNLKAKLSDITVIPKGFSEEEIWEIFSIVFGKLQNEDNIIFDVTHTFRSIPIFSVILLNYARLLKNTKHIAIHYGAFEKLGSRSEVKLLPLKQRIAPVLDIKTLVNLQDWTIAARNFIDYGKVDKIHNLLEERYKQLIRNSEGKNIEAQKLKNIDKKLIAHSESITLNKIENIIKGDDLKTALNEVKISETVMAPPFKPLIEKIEDKIKGFCKNSLNNIFSATEWCIQHELYQNAYSILLEGTISIILNKINEVYTGQTSLIELKRGSIIHVAQSLQQRKSMDECKNLFRVGNKSINEKAILYGTIEKVWNLMDIDLANIIAALNAKRNSYMHGGTGTNPLGSFKNLKNDIEKYCKYIKAQFTQNNKSNTANPVSISKMLINLSNHPISHWSDDQKKVANNRYGQVIDMQFPTVDPAGDEKYIKSLVKKFLSKIQNLTQDSSIVTVHIMGEMTFTFAMVVELQKLGIKCIASTTNRIVLEENGIKTSEFQFMKFREYERF